MTTELDNDMVYRCSCRDLAHGLALWSDTEEHGNVEVSMIVPWMPLRWRLQQAWAVLRGRPGTETFVSLRTEDARSLAIDLLRHADRGEGR